MKCSHTFLGVCIKIRMKIRKLSYRYTTPAPSPLPPQIMILKILETFFLLVKIFWMSAVPRPLSKTMLLLLLSVLEKKKNILNMCCHLPCHVNHINSLKILLFQKNCNYFIYYFCLPECHLLYAYTFFAKKT